jgi:hypothetical protein
MVSMFASSAVDLGFELQSGQTKDYEIGVCCFSAKHTALFNANSAILQLYYGKNQLIFNEMMMRSSLY